jgi:uncharacterized protein (TIGR02246 family)
MLHKFLMLRTILALGAAALFLTAANIPSGCAQPDTSPDDHIITEIRAVISAQQVAWNRGDIETFMKGYWRSDGTVFVSGDEVTRGWQTVYDRYKAKYSNREKMGTLTFSELEISALGPDSAVALGRWELKRAQDNPHGRFTLIFRRTPEGWRIVHDHTSAG